MVLLHHVARHAYREGFLLGAEWRAFLSEVPPPKRVYRLAAVLHRRGVLNVYNGSKKQPACVRFEFRRPVYISTTPGVPDPEGLLLQLVRVLCRPVPSWRCRTPAAWEAERVRRSWFTVGFRQGWQPLAS